MKDKALRIMIAEPEHSERLRLERDFNDQGYYAIASTASLKEMLILLEYGNRRFDLVLINADLMKHTCFNLISYCLETPSIRQAFIYSMPESGLSLPGPENGQRVILSTARSPSTCQITSLLYNFNTAALQLSHKQ